VHSVTPAALRAALFSLTAGSRCICPGPAGPAPGRGQPGELANPPGPGRRVLPHRGAGGRAVGPRALGRPGPPRAGRCL